MNIKDNSKQLPKKNRFFSTLKKYDIYSRDVSRIKPYIYSAVIARKYKYMVKHKNYSPNISSVFKYRKYSIDKDNGKNYKSYKAFIKLYCHMKNAFADESDVVLSDYCFANLNNLSE